MQQTDFDVIFKILPLEFLNTIYMVSVATMIALLIGLPLGIILAITDKGRFKENLIFYKTLAFIVNVGRSFPFAILMITLIPLTRLIIGSSLGTTASIVPLAIAAIPFFARVAEQTLKEVDPCLIEAATVMGSTTMQTIGKVLLKETLPSLVTGMILTTVTLIGYSAMAGLIGGGGLGKVAIQYGYNRFNSLIMTVTVIHIILLVQLIQWGGNKLAYKIEIKRGKNPNET